MSERRDTQVRNQPEEAEANRRNLRLAEDGRVAPEAATSGCCEGQVDIQVCGSGLQPCEDSESDSGVRRGVPELAEGRRDGTKVNQSDTP